MWPAALHWFCGCDVSSAAWASEDQVVSHLQSNAAYRCTNTHRAKFCRAATAAPQTLIPSGRSVALTDF